MLRTPLTSRLTLAAVLLACGAFTGCAQHRIPAIDPTGEHFFSGTTTLATHELFGGGHFHKHQQPAAASVAPALPPVKPPCTPPVEAIPVVPVPVVAVPQNPLPTAIPVVPVACGPQQMQPQLALPGRPQPGGTIYPTGAPAYRGPELSITPARIVAPVNTEVVMAAGICSPDGYYVTRQPLEWMLAQDGVGQIVAVGHESPHDTSFLLRNSPQKVATNYARAHTSTISQVLDRGTPNPSDDVYLHKGQSWISISSPTEGTSHVVVWAPKEMNWERRKSTATIYWVDAAWKFPQSATARAGQGQPLTTVVTRSGGEPINGWLVRYEVIDGPPAGFGRGLGSAVEVRTDGAGRATVDLLPRSPEPGITTVRVQVIRPGATRGDLPQIVVGQAVVAVQWTTPGLTLRAMGTNSVAADGAVGYRVEVTNSGDLVTHNVELSYTPPTGVTVLNSTPAGQPFGQRLVWRLGDLPPGSTSVVELNCRATVAGSIRSAFVATSTEVPKVEYRVQTDVRANALSVKMSGPETAEVGREVKFLIDVTNTGDTPLSNVTARDVFEIGLSHTGGEPSPLVRTIPVLGPRQTEKFAISFNVTQPGRHCHLLDVTADGGHAAAARACVTGTAAVVTPPQLSVQVTGPPSQRAGDVAPYLVVVKNSGTAPAREVTLAVTWGINLDLKEATQGHQDDVAQRTTRWRIAQLAGGESITRQLNCICRLPDEQGAVVRATVSSPQLPTVSHQAVTVIAPAAAAAPPRQPIPPQGPAPIQPQASSPPPQVSGSLRITSLTLANPIMVNAATTLQINIANDRSVADQNVALSVQVIGTGLTLRVAGTTPTGVAASSATAIDFQPIRELRANEQFPQVYRIEVIGVQPGRHKLRVTATSALTPSGTSTETELVVNAP